MANPHADDQLGFYQRSDSQIIDYHLFYDSTLKRERRGPVDTIVPGDAYFTAIGAAQTFGRFCEAPYPKLLADELGMPCYNLGRGGVGADYFLRWKESWDVINASRFIVVQVMSGQSVNTSLFRDPDGINRFWTPFHDTRVSSGEAWRHFYENYPREKLAALIEETRFRWVEDYILLSRKLVQPSVLFWISRRSPDAPLKLDRFGEFWSSFPQLVTREMVEEVKPYFSTYVELVSSSGLPQDLTQLGKGKPASVRMGIDAKPMAKNSYYPSPEMHVEARDVLLPAVQSLLKGTEPSYAEPPASDSVVERFVSMIGKPWMYPRLFEEISSLPPTALVLCSPEMHLSVTERVRGKCLTATPASFRTVLERENVDSIFILDPESAGLRALAEKAVARQPESIPILDLLADVLFWKSLRHNARRQPPRSTPSAAYSIICSPRTGSTLISETFAGTGKLGRPKEHLTVPICACVERGVFEFDDWLKALVETTQTPNGVFGTKLISDRMKRMQPFMGAAGTDLIRNQKIIRLRREDLYAQAISHYWSMTSAEWHRRKDSGSDRSGEVPYRFEAMLRAYNWIAGQEEFVDDFLAQTIRPENVITVTYESLTKDRRSVIETIIAFLGLDVEINVADTEPSLVKFESERKGEMIDRFKDELKATRGYV